MGILRPVLGTGPISGSDRKTGTLIFPGTQNPPTPTGGTGFAGEKRLKKWKSGQKSLWGLSAGLLSGRKKWHNFGHEADADSLGGPHLPAVG